jgi:hypothetical protein
MRKYRMKDKQNTITRAEGLYGDIIQLPHYEPRSHARMSMYKRAAQFAPFAALTGYGDAIDEAARYTDKGMDLSEDESGRMDRMLAVLEQEMEDPPEIMIRYFMPDEKKAGGSFVETKGKVKKIDDMDRVLVMQDGRRIPLKDIVDMDGKVFGGQYFEE